MSSVICTLFEKKYHLGVAALVNSLHKQGFKGDIYAGYTGSLPSWTDGAVVNANLSGLKAKTLKVAEEVNLHFLELNTDYHLANYKPDFMLSLLDGVAKDATGIFYFDPDIVVVRSWDIFEEWVSCGVTVCEDVNSPLQDLHMRRIAWRNFFGSKGIDLKFKNAIYVNSGFVGVLRAQAGFLKRWVEIQEAIAPIIGGLNRAPFGGASMLPIEMTGDYAPFSKTDQDALNAAIEAWDGNISFMGQEGMGFKSGPRLMSHALGKPKSWDWNAMSQIVKGKPPRTPEKDYWGAVSSPIKLYSNSKVARKRFFIKTAAFLGRFYN